MSKQPTKPILQRIQTASDDELDDLDDVLEEFSPANSIPSAPPPSALPSTTFGNRPRNNTRVDGPPISIPGTGPKLKPTSEKEELDEDKLSQEFARELQKGMEDLMQELGLPGGDKTGSSSSGNAGGSGGGTDMTEEERAKVLKAAWEAMLVEGLNGGDADGALSGLGELLDKDGVKPKPESEDPNPSTRDFESRIKQARDRLKESEKNLQSNPTAPGPDQNTESLEQLLASLGNLGLGGGAGDENMDESELAGILEGMMGQLMSKEVLYEPLKELSDKFPEYLANPPNALDPTDKTRYEKQFSYVQQIIKVFDEPSYSDTNTEASKKIMTLMNEMQNEGSPPPEIMGPLPPGFENGMPAPGDENCVVA